MKKVKALALVAIFAGSMMNAPTAEAKKQTFAHVYDNGCVGTKTYHSFLWGTFHWETYTVVDCPEGVEAPNV